MKSKIIFLAIIAIFHFSCSSDDSPQTMDSNSGDEMGDTDEATDGNNGGTDGGENTAETWITIPVPANPGAGMKWEFNADVSDDFEYLAPAANKGSSFTKKWEDWYHNPWEGPEPTKWKRENSYVKDGMLHILGDRPAGTTITNTGIITSKIQVQFPVYVEASAKVMNSTLANGIWMLSTDDTQEIDIAEAYGSDRWNNPWFAPDRMHLSHHVFIRDPFTDWQPHDEGSFYTDGSTIWREDFHRYGVYWKDPWNLEYYIDGKLVRTRSGKAEIDPQDHTNGTGLNKAMDLIINAEDQTWRANDGLSPTNAELENKENNTMKVDWIRIFKPVQQ